MKPNQMPKKQRDKVRERILGMLIETQEQSWKLKRLAVDDSGKEIVETQTVGRDALRWPLAQNVSEESVNAAARRWL